MEENREHWRSGRRYFKEPSQSEIAEFRIKWKAIFDGCLVRGFRAIDSKDGGSGKISVNLFIEMYDKVYQICIRGNGSQLVYDAFSEDWSIFIRQKYANFAQRLQDREFNSWEAVLLEWERFCTKFVKIAQSFAVLFSYLDRFHAVGNNLPQTKELVCIHLLEHFIEPSIPAIAKAFAETLSGRHKHILDVLDRDAKPELRMLHGLILNAVRPSNDIELKTIRLIKKFEVTSKRRLKRSLLRSFVGNLGKLPNWKTEARFGLPTLKQQISNFFKDNNFGDAMLCLGQHEENKVRKGKSHCVGSTVRTLQDTTVRRDQEIEVRHSANVTAGTKQSSVVYQHRLLPGKEERKFEDAKESK